MPTDSEKDWQESTDMLNSWLSISGQEANSAYYEATLFIQYFQKTFKNKFFDSYILSEILNRIKDGILIGDDERQQLLQRFIEDPLNPLALVTGDYLLNM